MNWEYIFILLLCVWVFSSFPSPSPRYQSLSFHEWCQLYVEKRAKKDFNRRKKKQGVLQPKVRSLPFFIHIFLANFTLKDSSTFLFHPTAFVLLLAAEYSHTSSQVSWMAFDFSRRNIRNVIIFYLSSWEKRKRRWARILWGFCFGEVGGKHWTWYCLIHSSKSTFRVKEIQEKLLTHIFYFHKCLHLPDFGERKVY
jgi:hypothetical protein